MADEPADAMGFQVGVGGTEVIERTMPVGAPNERAKIPKDEEALAGAREGQGQIGDVFAERYTAMRMAARETEHQHVALAMADLRRHGNFQAESTTLQDCRS